MATNPATQASKAEEGKKDEAKPEEGKPTEAPEAEESKEVKAKVLVFDPKVKATLNSTQHTITKTQLVEAGVKKPFADDKQTEVVWGLHNRYQVPVEQFTKEAVDRLVQEADISVQDED